MTDDETVLPYYDDYGTDQQRLGRKIYREALSDRRGFRYDQIGIDSEDEIWLEIFQNIGEVAEKYTRARVAAPSDSRQTVDVEKHGWKCNCCTTIFLSEQKERSDDGLGNGGAKCPRCKADGQYTYPYKLHLGDPCKYCNTPHDEVDIGQCKGITTPTQPVAAPVVSREDALDALHAVNAGITKDPIGYPNSIHRLTYKEVKTIIKILKAAAKETA